MRLLLLALLLTACGHKKDQSSTPPKTDPRAAELRTLYEQKRADIAPMLDPIDGWPSKDCDGMIWSARYGVTDPNVNILAAEYPDEPGKFGRRPAPWCWSAETGDNGSVTTWSRDMGIAGLFPYAFLTGRLDVLQRHAAYVTANHWFAGEPTADGRTLYTPQMIGILFKAIHALGGPSSANESWPTVYPSGLDDYQLHLEVSDIFLTGRIADAMKDSSARPTPPTSGNLVDTISATMYLRLKEAVVAEPNDPFYSYVYGQYTGDQTKTLDLLLDPLMPMAGYVRCDDPARCKLAQWFYVTHLLLGDLSRSE